MANPKGSISIQTIAMPKDTNWYGDIFGGWLVAQMDLAGEVCARQCAGGRVATIAIDHMTFLRPVAVGSVVSFHTAVESTGVSSIRVIIEAWITRDGVAVEKVTEGRFTFVSVNDEGKTQPLPAAQQQLAT